MKHHQGRGEIDQKLFHRCLQSQRDLACLVLADISLSTETHINNQQRVIDVAQGGLLLLSEALQASRDPFAVFAFSSRRRDHIRFHHIKSFDESYNSTIRGRIQALEPGYYTCMAVQEAHKAGITPFCVTIDDAASDYLPYIFGSNHFVVIRDPAQLPLQLPKLYLNLTQ
ncbi:MAG: hypothetical protein SVX28_01170 [Pseudomonadota bacterium]|nr:hypothetical protein [Pseudomonadota bacterium]